MKLQSTTCLRPKIQRWPPVAIHKQDSSIRQRADTHHATVSLRAKTVFCAPCICSLEVVISYIHLAPHTTQALQRHRAAWSTTKIKIPFQITGSRVHKPEVEPMLLTKHLGAPRQSKGNESQNHNGIVSGHQGVFCSLPK